MNHHEYVYFFHVYMYPSICISTNLTFVVFSNIHLLYLSILYLSIYLHINLPLYFNKHENIYPLPVSIYSNINTPFNIYLLSTCKSTDNSLIPQPSTFIFTFILSTFILTPSSYPFIHLIHPSIGRVRVGQGEAG